MLKKDETLAGDDVREGLTAIISIKHPDPQYEGQTKTKLGNSEVRKIVSNILGEQLERFFMEHPDIAKMIVDKAIVASKARLAAKKARELTRRKSALDGISSLPGKLSDCSSRNAENARSISSRVIPPAEAQSREEIPVPRRSCRCAVRS